jgi:uncharacterized spore protein YtfJ
MSTPENLFNSLAPRLEALAQSNAVIGPITSVGDKHVVPLVELSLGLGGGGGGGEGPDRTSGAHGKGFGGGAGGGAKVTPVAVIVVDGNKVSLQALGH